MNPNPIFLDNNGTTQPLPQVVEAMASALRDHWGNPSSNLTSGDDARVSLAQARESVAGLFSSPPERVIFCSSGTEANNTAIRLALAQSPGRRKVILGALEHASILEMIPRLRSEGYSLVILKAKPSGQVDLDALCESVDEETALVSTQWINNETGVIQPIEQIREICQDYAVTLHSDAAQAVGKITNLSAEAADFLTCTAHKIHGPKGVGALLLPELPSASLAAASIFSGGQQESGIRPGTENTSGIIGFGEAARLRSEALSESISEMARLRDYFETGLRTLHPEIRVNGSTDYRVCNTTNLCFPDIHAESLVNRLDLDGIECSQASACTSARPEPSHVLTAMGLSEDEAYGSIRFSFSVLNSIEQAELAVCAVSRHYSQIKNSSLSYVA